VAACHSLNGLDDDETWRDVGQLLGDDVTPYIQTITSACHHCEDPACANGCPVLAYEKSPETGIVRHLDDQCIGCSYCILKCPYDVPKFNKKRGIVRKCDMCQGRLAIGEAPACVQSCPSHAIAIRVVKVHEEDPNDKLLKVSDPILPGLIESTYTRPTTRYLSAKPVPAVAEAADAARPKVETAHTPLAIMLVLTQAAAGALTFAQNQFMLWLGFAMASIGITASIAHLGQPLKAWRCFLGLRKSWLSREIVAFGAFPALALGAALGWSPGWAAAAIGWISVFCSVMVYVDTRRPLWTMPWTASRFFGTILLCGTAIAACYNSSFISAAVTIGVIKIAWEGLYFLSRNPRNSRSQKLLLGPLKRTQILRFVAGIVGVMALPFAPVIGCVLIAAGEFVERTLFFRGAAAWKMPGG
jgi:Fe-S-cluster-containing dehydrogenase component/DMSO reductase anchor subunit